MLTTESSPAAGMVYPLLNLLADELTVNERPDEEEADSADSGGDDDDYDSQISAKLKRCIWDRLQKRFDLTQDGQPHTDLLECCPLMIAAFCDPRWVTECQF